MPLYEYQCPKCGVFELIRKFSDEPLAACPTCGSKVQKLASAPAFHLKGTGWYVTDYAKKPSGDSKPGEGKSGENKSGESRSGGGESGEGKSGEGKSSDSKSGESKSADSKSPESKSDTKASKDSSTGTPAATTKKSR